MRPANYFSNIQLSNARAGAAAVGNGRRIMPEETGCSNSSDLSELLQYYEFF